MSDSRQEQICGLFGCKALVLAPPGCGKTHILARRIFEANALHGVDFSDMLCLTFTNRAAREMNERVNALLGYTPEGLFVGNIHRFCIRFLFANNLVASETGILDEEDQLEYLNAAFGISDARRVADFQRAATYIYQTEHDFPPGLIRKLNFSLTTEMREAVQQYSEYKKRHKLLDFDEIILRAYQALSDVKADSYTGASFSWIQVDEVQDMTPVQLAVTDLLLRHSEKGATALYLGDEQQAIFSFLGAGGVALDRLKLCCNGEIHRMFRNFRSPWPLVRLCNALAEKWLPADRDFLPGEHDCADTPDEDIYSRAVLSLDPCAMLSGTVTELREKYPGESIGVLCFTNRRCDEASRALTQVGLEHILLSRLDVFKQAAFKTVIAHLSVTVNAFRTGEWARLLCQCGCVRSLTEGRRITAGLLERGICPDELLNFDEPGYLARFTILMDKGRQHTVAVIDTETTGLDIFADDIVQIGAVKMRGGEIVEGSRLEILIHTDKTIPRFLGSGISNPLVEVYSQGNPLDPEAAFGLLADYLSDVDAVAGHNLDFDLEIIRFNYQRRAPSISFPDAISEEAARFDTLDIARLCYPHRRDYKLESLCRALKIEAIEGTTFHLAAEDAESTARLAISLKPEAEIKIEQAAAIRKNTSIQRIARKLSDVYGPHYRRSRRLMSESGISSENTLTAEISRFYNCFAGEGIIHPIPRFEYLCRLIDECVVDTARQPHFREQITRGLYELLTFNEGDMFSKGIVYERVSVMTVHKAKGLEMDNVVIFAPGYPHGSIEERARVYYVAFSRAKKRIIIIGQSRFDEIVESIKEYFSLFEG